MLMLRSRSSLVRFGSSCCSSDAAPAAETFRGKPAFSLKHFISRKKTLDLYRKVSGPPSGRRRTRPSDPRSRGVRQVLKTARGIGDESAFVEIRNTARTDFRLYMDEKDDEKILYMRDMGESSRRGGPLASPLFVVPTPS